MAEFRRREKLWSGGIGPPNPLFFLTLLNVSIILENFEEQKDQEEVAPGPGRIARDKRVD
jgi:hypothetical protein